MPRHWRGKRFGRRRIHVARMRDRRHQRPKRLERGVVVPMVVGPVEIPPHVLRRGRKLGPEVDRPHVPFRERRQHDVDLPITGRLKAARQHLVRHVLVFLLSSKLMQVNCRVCNLASTASKVIACPGLLLFQSPVVITNQQFGVVLLHYVNAFCSYGWVIFLQCQTCEANDMVMHPLVSDVAHIFAVLVGFGKYYSIILVADYAIGAVFGDAHHPRAVVCIIDRCTQECSVSQMAFFNPAAASPPHFIWEIRHFLLAQFPVKRQCANYPGKVVYAVSVHSLFAGVACVSPATREVPVTEDNGGI